MKNEFNYSIKYYYNIILHKLNKVYSYILNYSQNGEISDEKINEIKKIFDDLIIQITK